jgi:hypothetical protein
MKYDTLRITPTEREKLEKMARFRSGRAEGVQRARLVLVASRYRGSKPRVRTAALEARMAKTPEAPRDGSTHWSTRRLAAELDVSHMIQTRM